MADVTRVLNIFANIKTHLSDPVNLESARARLRAAWAGHCGDDAALERFARFVVLQEVAGKVQYGHKPAGELYPRTDALIGGIAALRVYSPDDARREQSFDPEPMAARLLAAVDGDLATLKATLSARVTVAASGLARCCPSLRTQVPEPSTASDCDFEEALLAIGRELDAADANLRASRRHLEDLRRSRFDRVLVRVYEAQ